MLLQLAATSQANIKPSQSYLTSKTWTQGVYTSFESWGPLYTVILCYSRSEAEINSLHMSLPFSLIFPVPFWCTPLAQALYMWTYITQMHHTGSATSEILTWILVVGSVIRYHWSFDTARPAGSEGAYKSAVSYNDGLCQQNILNNLESKHHKERITRIYWNYQHTFNQLLYWITWDSCPI